MCSKRDRVLSKYRFAQVKRIRQVCNKERFKINTVNLSTYIETHLKHAHKSEKNYILRTSFTYWTNYVFLYPCMAFIPLCRRFLEILFWQKLKLWIPIILFRWTNIFGWFWFLLLLSFSFFVTILGKKMSQREIELNPNKQ